MLPIVLLILLQTITPPPLPAPQALPLPRPLPAEEPVAPYTHSDANAGGTPLKGKATWHAFHEQAGVDRIIDDLIDRSIVDKRISDIFKGQDMIRLRRTLKEQVCYLLNGGCAYTGRNMHDAHANMGIQDADLTALVENLQAAMRVEGVPFPAQNRLLAKLAPMRRVVVKQVGVVASDAPVR